MRCVRASLDGGQLVYASISAAIVGLLWSVHVVRWGPACGVRTLKVSSRSVVWYARRWMGPVCLRYAYH